MKPESLDKIWSLRTKMDLKWVAAIKPRLVAILWQSYGGRGGKRDVTKGEES